MKIKTIITALLMALTSCFNQVSNLTEVIVDSDSVITYGYVGTGAQWDGYNYISQYTNSAQLSSNDWNTLCKRIDFMRPGVIRVMGGLGNSYDTTGDKAITENVIIPILDYCQKRGITVVFGEWGHTGGDQNIDEKWLDYAINYLDWLVNTKKYTCIKYYMLVNEPNGFWSSMNNNYALWQMMIRSAHQKMDKLSLLDKVEIMGPDIAYWNMSSALEFRNPWIDTSVAQMNDQIGSYDIHAYPGHDNVRSGQFQASLDTLLRAIPQNKKIFMMELGGKYPDEPKYDKENKRRQLLDPYTSDNANLFIYDAFYGIDMADAILQCMNVGIDGISMWDMDDAMHNAYYMSSDKPRLHRWGFWNILGDELHNNPEDENIRPWFYTVSLLSRYIPAGSNIFKVETNNKNIRVVAAEKDTHYTIAFVNPTNVEKTFKLRFKTKVARQNMDLYRFVAGNGSQFIGELDPDGLAQPWKKNIKVNLNNGYNITLPASSFIMLTSVK